MAKSLAEQLGENFETLSEGVTTETVEIGREPEIVEPAEPVDRTRDESGRFAKETLRLKEGPKRDPKTGGHLAEEKPQEGEQAIKAEAPAQVAQPSEENSKEIIPAPVEWTGGAKVKWDRLPYEVKKSLAEDYKHVSQAKALNPVLQPFVDRFNMDFGGTPQALTAILNTWKYAKQQPVDFVREFLQSTGIDPRTLVGGQAQPEQETDPFRQVLTPIQQELQDLKGQLQQLAAQPLKAQEAHIDNEIQAFQADPAHPYFNDVKPIMAALMQAGSATTLKEAYDMACHANPQIRSQLEQKRAMEEQEKRRQATGRAASAAVSVNGAPGVARPSVPQHQSVADAVRANFELMEGRA